MEKQFKCNNSSIEELFNLLLNYPLDVKESKDSILIPGRVIRVKVFDNLYTGIMLTFNKAVYFDSEGKIKGYVTGLTKDSSVLEGVYEPTEQNYQLSEYLLMKKIFERKNKVQKTLSEIEKELGLAPGTLEINNE